MILAQQPAIHRLSNLNPAFAQLSNPLYLGHSEFLSLLKQKKE